MLFSDVIISVTIGKYVVFLAVCTLLMYPVGYTVCVLNKGILLPSVYEWKEDMLDIILYTYWFVAWSHKSWLFLKIAPKMRLSRLAPTLPIIMV